MRRGQRTFRFSNKKDRHFAASTHYNRLHVAAILQNMGFCFISHGIPWENVKILWDCLWKTPWNVRATWAKTYKLRKTPWRLYGLPWNHHRVYIFLPMWHENYTKYFTWNLIESPCKISRVSPWNSVGYKTWTPILQDRRRFLHWQLDSQTDILKNFYVAETRLYIISLKPLLLTLNK